MAVSVEQVSRNHMCNRCHDGDNSPKFDFDSYYAEIDHAGLDDYNDPKVHQGIAPRLARSRSTDAPGNRSE
jgi:hypothetical protein